MLKEVSIKRAMWLKNGEDKLNYFLTKLNKFCHCLILAN